MSGRGARAGKAYERQVDETNAFLMQQGLAFVFKVPDPMQVKYREGRNYLARKSAAVYADFAGMLADGRFVGFDAKRCEDTDRFPFSQLSDHQRWCLQMTAAFGGHAFVLVLRVDGARWNEYVFPVDEDGIIAGVTDAKSIRWDAAGAFMVPRGQTWFDQIVRAQQ